VYGLFDQAKVWSNRPFFIVSVEKGSIIMSTSRIVYTAASGGTVTIDYDETLRLFLSQKERLPFSAGKLLQMLNRRTSEASVWHTGVGLRVSVGEVRCILTQQPTNVLAGIYQRSHDLQAEYPGLLRLFAFAAEEEKGVCP